MRSDVAPGGTFPDYELPDHTGNSRRSSDLWRDLRAAAPSAAS